MLDGFQDGLIQDIFDDTCGGEKLNDWEREFIESIQRQDKLSLRQTNRLTDIWTEYTKRG